MCISHFSIGKWVHHTEEKGKGDEGVIAPAACSVLHPIHNTTQTEVSSGICMPPGCGVDAVPKGCTGCGQHPSQQLCFHLCG